MDIQNLKYNRELIKTKSRLEKELEMVNDKIKTKQESCNHIKVCIGWNGPFLYRDTSIDLCLLCCEDDPNTKFRVIEAYDYKKEEYDHGQLSSYREKRFEDLQQLTMNIMTENPSITEEQLIEKLNIIIEEDKIKEKKLGFKPI